MQPLQRTFQPRLRETCFVFVFVFVFVKVKAALTREENLAANSAAARKFIEDMELSMVNQEHMRL